MTTRILDYDIATLLKELHEQNFVPTTLLLEHIYKINDRLPIYEEPSNITIKED